MRVLSIFHSVKGGEEMKTKNKEAAVSFLRKYGYYIVLVASVALLTLIVTLASLSGGGLNVGKDIQVDAQPVNFALPVESVTVLKGYSGTELQYNNTLKQWEAHKAVDFSGASGESVFAVYGGTITEVYSNYLLGNVVVLKLKDGLSVLYASLGSDTIVKVGDTVTKGQKIGVMGDSAKSEASDGAHLHLEVYKNNVKVDPGIYLDLEAK